MCLVFRVVNCLSLKWNIFSLILHRWVWYFFYFFRTEFKLISCCAIKFGLVSIINICTSCWSLWIDLERNVTFFILCFIIEWSLFLCILDSSRGLLRLNFVCFVVIIVWGFQITRIIMSLLYLISARLLSLWDYFIRFIVMMIGSLSSKLNVLRWAVMFTWINIKSYHRYKFDKRIYHWNIHKGQYYQSFFLEYTLSFWAK